MYKPLQYLIPSLEECIRNAIHCFVYEPSYQQQVVVIYSPLQVEFGTYSLVVAVISFLF